MDLLIIETHEKKVLFSPSAEFPTFLYTYPQSHNLLRVVITDQRLVSRDKCDNGVVA